MSVYFTVKEKISFNGKILMPLRTIMAENFIKLMGASMVGTLTVSHCRIKCRKFELEFTGNDLEKEMRTIINALLNERRVEYTIVYSGYNIVGINEDEYLFKVMEYLCPQRSGQTPGSRVKPSGFFYESYYSCDCSDSNFGVLFAYGEKDGKKYNGMVKPEAVDISSCEGKWESSCWNYLVIGGNMSEGQYTDDVRALCNCIAGFLTNDRDAVYEPGDEIESTIEFNPKTIQQYIALTAELMKKVGGVLPYFGAFMNDSGEFPMELSVEFDDEFVPHYFITRA